MSDRIEKEIVINAPRSRVWKALTDHEQFGQWFGISLAGPFVAGQKVSGVLKIAEYANVSLSFHVDAVEPERRFAYRWHPYPMDPEADYSKEEPTLVEFLLEDVPGGTRLAVTESGFDKVPAERRVMALQMNTRGWDIQLANIQRHVQTT